MGDMYRRIIYNITILYIVGYIYIIYIVGYSGI